MQTQTLQTLNPVNCEVLDVEEVKQHLESGLSASFLASYYNINSNSFLVWMKKQGLEDYIGKSTRVDKVLDPELETIKERLEAGEPPHKIVNYYDCSSSSFNTWLRKQGLGDYIRYRTDIATLLPELERIKEKLEAGESSHSIAIQYNVSHQGFTNLLRSNGLGTYIRTMKNIDSYLSSEFDTIKELLELGESARSVAIKYDINPGALCGWLRRHGLGDYIESFRKRLVYTDDDKATIVKMFMSGQNPSSICNTLNKDNLGPPHLFCTISLLLLRLIGKDTYSHQINLNRRVNTSQATTKIHLSGVDGGKRGKGPGSRLTALAGHSKYYRGN